VTRYRPELYAAARATGSDAAREIADALYADLYGVEVRDGRRRSLLEYFHGRSKLSTWLRSVMGQRYVDFVRTARRVRPLEDERVETPAEAGRPAADPDPARDRYLGLLRRALGIALASLDDRGRLRLSCYYVQGLTLAQIGRLTGEHEATVSRKLDRARRELRDHVDRALETQCGLSRDQIAVCYEYALQDWPFDLERALDEPPAQVAGPKPF
jgi:RNA polymerase sigma factor (sigma-70 family)